MTPVIYFQINSETSLSVVMIIELIHSKSTIYYNILKTKKKLGNE